MSRLLALPTDYRHIPREGHIPPLQLINQQKLVSKQIAISDHADRFFPL
ncbi:MAG TPA: hypothetical protein VE242_07880 [Chthoniobacterales bacterium]|nr:hypothetical protein [Chthoniobacterales bacterium]